MSIFIWSQRLKQVCWESAGCKFGWQLDLAWQAQVGVSSAPLQSRDCEEYKVLQTNFVLQAIGSSSNFRQTAVHAMTAAPPCLCESYGINFDERAASWDAMSWNFCIQVYCKAFVQACCCCCDFMNSCLSEFATASTSLQCECILANLFSKQSWLDILTMARKCWNGCWSFFQTQLTIEDVKMSCLTHKIWKECLPSLRLSSKKNELQSTAHVACSDMPGATCSAAFCAIFWLPIDKDWGRNQPACMHGRKMMQTKTHLALSFHQSRMSFRVKPMLLAVVCQQQHAASGQPDIGFGPERVCWRVAVEGFSEKCCHITHRCACHEAAQSKHYLQPIKKYP